MVVVLKDMEAQILIIWKSVTEGEEKNPEVRKLGLQGQPLHSLAGKPWAQIVSLGFVIQRNGRNQTRAFPKVPKNNMILSHVNIVLILLLLLKMGKTIHRCSYQMQVSKVLVFHFRKQYSFLKNMTLFTLNQVSLQKTK